MRWRANLLRAKGAGDCAIRIIKELMAENKELKAEQGDFLTFMQKIKDKFAEHDKEIKKLERWVGQLDRRTAGSIRMGGERHTDYMGTSGLERKRLKEEYRRESRGWDKWAMEHEVKAWGWCPEHKEG